MYGKDVGCSMHWSKWLVKWDQEFCGHRINLLEAGVDPGQYPQIPGLEDTLAMQRVISQDETC